MSSAKSEFSRISTALKQKGWDEAYASSGTVKMLMHVSNGNGNDSGSDTISLNLLLNLRLKILK